jgi:hypothetical protein
MSVNVADLLGLAEQQLGKQYVYGTAGPDTFDCSGLVSFVYHKFGVNLPHHAQDQATYGTAVNKSQIQPGDLVFSDWGDGPSSHVGIAVSPKKVIDAPHKGAVVRYDDLTPNYLQHVTAVRRVTDTTGQAPSLPSVISGAGGIVGDLVQPLRDIASAAGDVAHVGDQALKLFMPSNFLRVMAGAGGVLLILLGILFLSREARSS